MMTMDQIRSLGLAVLIAVLVSCLSSGLALAENIDPDNTGAQWAWGENVGWINLNDATHFVAVGPCVAGDLDCDGEVTLDDFAGFPSSLSGPEAATACSAFDVDNDNDVDLADFAELQRLFMEAP